MPTTSKYVFVQKNSNGQYTTYGSIGKNITNANVNQLGNFVVLTTEPMTANSNNNNNNNNNTATTSGVMATSTPTKNSINISDSSCNTATISTITTGENDDNELRPLAWLNDSNLIKGIVTNDSGNNNNTNNICIINATDAHELIEELPHHLAGEENVATTVITHVIEATQQMDNNKNKIKINDNQQQLVDVLVNNNNNNNNNNMNNNGDNNNTNAVNDFQKQFIVNASKRFNIQNSTSMAAAPTTTTTTTNFLQKQQQQQLQKINTFTYTTNNNNDNKDHQITNIFDNMTALGTNATTTVHVGPSGTTTVVEYKTNKSNNNNNKSNVQQQQKQKIFTNILPNTTNTTTTTSSAAVANTTIATSINFNNYNTSNINSIINNCKTNYTTSANTSSVIQQMGTGTFEITNNPNNNNNNNNNIPQTAAINFVRSDNYAIVTNSNNNNNNTTNNNNNNNNNKTTINYIKMQKQINNHSSTITTTGTTTTTTTTAVATTTTNSSSNSSSTTTHHPHKKYLREKMCFKEYNNNNDNTTTTTTIDAINTTTNKISSYNASSYIENNNSNNSAIKSSSTTITTTSTPTSTPISSTFYNIIPNNSLNNNVTTLAVSCNAPPTNLSTTSLGNSTPTSYVTLAAASSNVLTNNDIPAYTIVNSHQLNNPSLLTLPESAVVLSNDYYNLTKVSQENQKQQQQPLQNHDILQQQTQHEVQSLDLRSPTSYTSYDNDSIKDFETNTNLYVSQQQQQQQSYQNPTNNKQIKSRALNASTGSGSGNNTPQKHKHPNNVPYDPLVHTHNKPPYSFSSLIFMAIEGSNERALPVKEIYAWIVAHFPYFKTAPTGWKNSVRHNLSLNKSFVKVEKAPHMGKGSLWRVEPQQRQNLIQALTRSPFFPNSTVDKITTKNANAGIGNEIVGLQDEDSGPSNSHAGVCEDEIVATKPISSSGSGNSNAGNSAKNINGRFDPRLFPNLSKAFSDMEAHNVLNDVPDHEIPSDFSTNNHNNMQHQQQHLTQHHNNNTDSYQLKNNNNQHKNTPKIQQNNGCVNEENLPAASTGVAGTSAMGPVLLINNFSSYESLEHLTRDCGADSMDDVNAATAMLALKHGPKIFSENFHNSAPVITSSPSEDHTYSAGGSSNAGSGASTPLMLNNNGTATPLIISLNSNGNAGNREQQQLVNGCDNQSNCASSEDAAYESSDEIHNNMSMEQLADQQRHRDGVDALLSLSLSSSVLDSSPNTSSLSSAYSPIKRAYTNSMEDEHYNIMINSVENSNNNLSSPTRAKSYRTIFSGGNQPHQQQQHSVPQHGITDYNNTYYNQQEATSLGQSHVVLTKMPSTHVNNLKHGYHGNEHLQQPQQQQQQRRQTTQLNAHNLSYLSPSPPKRSKQLRSLRTKIKRKSWIR